MSDSFCSETNLHIVWRSLARCRGYARQPSLAGANNQHRTYDDRLSPAVQCQRVRGTFLLVGIALSYTYLSPLYFVDEVFTCWHRHQAFLSLLRHHVVKQFISRPAPFATVNPVIHISQKRQVKDGVAPLADCLHIVLLNELPQ